MLGIFIEFPTTIPTAKDSRIKLYPVQLLDKNAKRVTIITQINPFDISEIFFSLFFEVICESIINIVF